MKKILLTVATALLLLPAALRADEGMWLLPLLEKMNSDALRNLGSRLTPEQIYSVNHSSIKDAIVQFGGGCTGEIISGSGLLVTNHHCGYGNIQALSSTEHNYLEDGYFAMSRAEELPCPGLTVRFLQSMTDVTDELAAGKGRQELIAAAEQANPHCQVRIVSFYNDNVQYLIVSKIYRDVRFVGAPPASSGKFGGDTDNWMWPRHTCDFSMFRVYAGPDNEPAEYSPANVPMRPRQFLNISLKGVQEGDFAMIMGYPGSTQRFQTATQLQDMLDNNDIRIAARGVRQDVLWKAMRADEKVGLQYASKYSGSSNGWKKWIGEKEAFEALDIIGREQQKERELSAWISADAGRQAAWGDAIARIADNVQEASRAKYAATLLSETLGRIEILNFAAALASAPELIEQMRGSNPDAQIDEQAAYAEILDYVREQYKDYDATVDRDVAIAMIDHYKARVNPADAVQLKGKSILTQDTRKLVEFGEDFDGGADIVWHGGRVDGRERFVDGLGGVGVVAFFAGCGDEGGDAADRGAFARFGLKRDGPKSVGEGVVGGFFPEGDEVGDAEVVQHRLGERGFAGEVENLRKVELDVSLLFEQIQRPSARGRFLAASAERPALGALDLQQPEGFAKFLFRFVRLSQHGEDAGERVEVRRHRHPFDGALRGLERFGVAPHPV